MADSCKSELHQKNWETELQDQLRVHDWTMISKNSYWIFRALPGRRRGGGGLGDTFTTTNAASFGLGGVFGGGKPRSAGIKIGGGTDPMIGK